MCAHEQQRCTQMMVIALCSEVDTTQKRLKSRRGGEHANLHSGEGTISADGIHGLRHERVDARDARHIRNDDLVHSNARLFNKYTA